MILTTTFTEFEWTLIWVSVVGSILLALLLLLNARAAWKEKQELLAKKQQEERLTALLEKKVLDEKDTIEVLKHPLKAAIRIIYFRKKLLSEEKDEKYIKKWLHGYFTHYLFSNRTDKAKQSTLADDYKKLCDCVENYIEKNDPAFIEKMVEIVNLYGLLDVNSITSGYTEERFCEKYEFAPEELKQAINNGVYPRRIMKNDPEGEEIETPYLPRITWEEAMKMICLKEACTIEDDDSFLMSDMWAIKPQ